MNEEKATRYHRLRRRATSLSLMLSGALLAGLLGTGASHAIRDLAGSAVSELGVPAVLGPSAVVVTYVLILGVVNEALTFVPSVYAGLLLERRYGLSAVSARRWLWEHLKAAGVFLAVATPATVFVYCAIRIWPTVWWIIAGTIFAMAAVGLVRLAPSWLVPVWCRLTPVERPTLRDRLEALTARAGAATVGVYAYRLSGASRRANAALVGVGHARRILLSDTLLREYSDEEIEVVLAHELAHYVHGDIWKGLACDAVLMLTGFYVAHRALVAFAPAFAVQSLGDVAGLPLMLLTAGMVSTGFMPLANVLSRHHERRADRYALEMTRNPEAFVSAMRRLGAQNLAEYRPSRLIEIVFFSHPPVERRIAAAQQLAHAWDLPLASRPAR